MTELSSLMMTGIDGSHDKISSAKLLTVWGHKGPLWFKTEHICEVLLPNILNSLHSGNYLSAVWFNCCSGKWWLKIHTVRWLRSLALAPHQADHFLSCELLVKEGEISFDFSCSHSCKKKLNLCGNETETLKKNWFVLIWLFWSKQHKLQNDCKYLQK